MSYEILAPRDTGLKLETTNGGVRLRAPLEVPARLEAGTVYVYGSVTIDSPAMGQG